MVASCNSVQDAEGDVVLPVSQPQLLDCMRPGDEVSICRYLSVDQDNRKASLTVVAKTATAVTCEARYVLQALPVETTPMLACGSST